MYLFGLFKQNVLTVLIYVWTTKRPGKIFNVFCAFSVILHLSAIENVYHIAEAGQGATQP